MIAITGHRDLTPESVPLVRAALREHLTSRARASSAALVGVSCLDEGADSMFAELVLELGGKLHVVEPALDYVRRCVSVRHSATYLRLRGHARTVHTTGARVTCPEAFEAANRTLVDLADELVAVWDRQPGTGRGGTAHAVQWAIVSGKDVTVLWPEGAQRAGATG